MKTIFSFLLLVVAMAMIISSLTMDYYCQATGGAGNLEITYGPLWINSFWLMEIVFMGGGILLLLLSLSHLGKLFSCHLDKKKRVQNALDYAQGKFPF